MFYELLDCVISYSTNHVKQLGRIVSLCVFLLAHSKELLGGHHKLAAVPGGFGAAAGPNDGFHNLLHMLTKAYLRCATGWGSAPLLRKRLDELEMTVQGNSGTKKLALNYIDQTFCFES